MGIFLLLQKQNLTSTVKYLVFAKRFVCLFQSFAKVLSIRQASGTSILQVATSPGEGRSIWPAS